MSRAKNSLYNLITGLGSQILVYLFSFITRTVFINTLGVEYLGLSGLFSNLLFMLSLAELGFGTAIIYDMYKPVAQRDEHQLYLLMKFYKTVYRIVGAVVAAIGLLMLPFLPSIINNPPTFINIYLIFTMYLLQSVSTYFFFAYKSSLLRAYQKTYIITNVVYIVTISTLVVQIVCLHYFKNYVLYLVIGMVSNVLQNLLVARISDKKYPYINKKSNDKLPQKEQKEILRNCFALSINKINTVVLNATDNIILSKVIGLAVVGLYSNYLLITAGIKSLTGLLFTSISSSVGNLYADTNVDREKELLVFKAINMLTFALHGIAVIGMFVVINPLISVWLGDDYLLPQFFVFLISADLYFFGMHRSTYVFRTAMGLFQQAKYRPLAGIMINLVVSIALVKPWGISGVIFGTVFASVTTCVWLDPYVVFKYGFQRSVKPYYITNLLYIGAVTGCGAAAYWISGLIPLTGILYIAVISLISVLLPSAVFYLLVCRTPEFKYLFSMAKALAGNFHRKKCRNK